MNIYKRYFAVLLSFIAFSFTAQAKNIKEVVAQRVAQSITNLIPSNAGTTPSYFCTWSAQNYAFDIETFRKMIGLGDHSLAADKLTEETVYGSAGWEKKISAEVKKDLYLMFDNGWDVAGGAYFDKKNKWILGAIDVASDKFPSCTGTSAEKLKKFNQLAKNAGWKGAGLWIAAQTTMESRGLKPTDQALEDYYRERLKWCKEAGIEYWKVDYGKRGTDHKYREMIVRLAAEIIPGLWIEHCRCGGPFNDQECPWDVKPTKTGRFSSWGAGEVQKTSVQTLNYSPVFRTYDVSPQLSIPTTIDRVASLLTDQTVQLQSNGILNCEDEPYIAAALGCAIGVMRHPDFVDFEGMDYDPLKTRKQMDAVVRAVKWQRISPAFRVTASVTLKDSIYLEDYWNFKPGQFWGKWMIGKTIEQAAPARVARGMELPIVAKMKGKSPYVVCSKFPNGNYAVATLMRTDSIHGFENPLGEVSIKCTTKATIGVFGNYKSLTIRFEKSIRNYRVLAQDLAGDKAIDITDLIERKANKITLSAEIINSVGLSAASLGDLSQPGFILSLK